jgi:pyruvate ferredoxin oxidoreductase gamma subunit
MQKFIEIRWHGRGGQGAKTAALVLGEAILGAGKYMQAFPEYGPERMGAPVKAYNRISDEPITIHSGVTQPSIVLVLDPSLISTVDITHGLPDDGILIINTPETPLNTREKLKLKHYKLFTVDASKISVDTIGRPIPNTPMLGALIKATGLLDFSKVVDDTRKKLEQKFRSKPEVIDGNIKAMERAYDEVRSE